MRRHKETKHDYDKRKMKSARDLLVQLDLGSEDLVFLIALDKFNKALGDTGEVKEEGMKDAMEDFKEVEERSVLYARALVYLARCSFEMGKYDDALKAFDAFKRKVDTMPPAGTQKQRLYRTIALAEGAFWRSETLLRMGEALKKEKNVSKARERYQEAFDALKGFESDFKSQQDFFPAVMYNRVVAKLGLQAFDEAEKLYNDLKDKYPDSNRTSTAAYYFGLALIEKAQGERTDPSAPASKEYIASLKKGTEYMKNYCEVSGYDSFTNLKNVCEWYQELGDLGVEGAYETSRETYQILLKEFGGNAEYENEIQGAVYRGYAEVLNKLRDFDTAKPIWLRLLSKDSKNVGILRATALCMGGWLEQMEDGTLVEVPGTGDYAPELTRNRDPNKISLDNAYNIWNYLLTGITHRGDRGKQEWYEAKFFTAYILYRAGVKEPAYFEWSRKIISNLRVLHPDMGGTEFRRKFKYVEDNIGRRR
jgi:tetratricopeptide (TPR) repeat protein